MVIDNQFYSRNADTWWTEDSALCLIRMHINPCRFTYFREIMDRMAIDPRQCRVLDIGCGGGFLSEEFAKIGCRVVGVDPSAESLEAARAHAAQNGLDIDYRESFAEQLPCDNAEFDIVCCCDVLDHVRDIKAVIAEIARVLRPGGPFFFDTINRTWRSWLFYIKIAQDWQSTAYVPRNVHDWDMFVRPSEVQQQLEAVGMDMKEVVGFLPNIGPLKVISELRRLKRGELTFGQYAQQMEIVRSRDVSCAYMGYAHKPVRKAK